MIKRVKESPVIYEGTNVTGRLISETEHLEYVHLSLEEDCSMEPHTLDIDADFFVISGEGVIDINGFSHKIKEGDFLRVNKGDTRALFTHGTQRMKILVIKSI